MSTAPPEAQVSYPSATCSNTETRLWKCLRANFRKPFHEGRFFHLCRLAGDIFARDAEQGVVLRDFGPTWKSFLSASHVMHEFDWCATLIDILRDEVVGARPFPATNPNEFRHSGYYLLNLSRWFPQPRTCRSKLREKISLVQAARACGISALSLLLDHDLVEVQITV